MATQTWNLYTGTGAESNRSDSLLMKAVATFNPDYKTTVARLSVTYTLKKTADKGFTKPGDRYGILTKGTAVNSSGQITTRGSLLKATSSALDTITDLSEGGSITKTVTFDFTKGSSATTYSGVTFFINDNNTSINHSADNTYQWTGQQGSSVSSLPSRFAVISFTVPVGFTDISNVSNVVATPPIVKPGGTVTISWTAATAGTNNPVKDYTVIFNGTTKTVTTNTTTFTAPSSRGATLYATVLPNPTASGFGPSTGVTSNNIVTNTLPTGSITVNFNSTLLSQSKETQLTVTNISGGSTNNTGQTLSYYYSTTQNGTKNSIAKNGTIKIPASSSVPTLYFWLFDELEYSSTATTYNNFTINTIPTIGSISITSGATTISSTNYFANNGATVKFKFNNVATGNTGQTPSYYYSTSSTGSGTSTSATPSISVPSTVQNSITYYFWVDDGLDTSTRKSVTVTKSNALTGISAAFSGGNNYTHSGLTTAQNNLYYLNETATISTGTQSNPASRSYTFKWNIASKDLTGTETVISSPSYTDTKKTTQSVNTKDIISTRGVIYLLQYEVTDNINNKFTGTLPYRIIAPVISGIENNIYNNNNINTPGLISYSLNKYFKDNIIFTLNNTDNSMTLQYTINNGANITGVANSGKKVKLTIGNTVIKTTYTITVTAPSVNGAAGYNFGFTVQTPNDPNISNLQRLDSTEFHPFISNSELQLQASSLFSGNNYNLLGNNWANGVIILNGSNKLTVSNLRSSRVGTSNVGQINISIRDITNTSESISILKLDYNTDYTLKVYGIIVQDVFGFNHTLDYSNKNINFNVNFREGLDSAALSTIGESIPHIDNNIHYLHENETLTFNSTVRSYNTGTLIQKLYISKSENGQSWGNWSRYPNSSQTWSQIISGTRDDSYLITSDFDFTYTLGQISESKYVKFKVEYELINTKYAEETNAPSRIAVKQLNPTNIVGKGELSDDFINIKLVSASPQVEPTNKITNYKLGLALSLTDPTLATKKYLQDISSTQSLVDNKTYFAVGSLPFSTSESANIVVFAKALISNILSSSWERCYCQLIYETYYNPNPSNSENPNTSAIISKETVSNIFTIYNTTPTISYRKNKIGINTNNIDSLSDPYSSAVLVIGAGDNKNYIVLKGDGEIAKIDIDTGELVGFTLDGGSW